MRRAVFLDRDGVLNESVVRNGKPFPPASTNQMVICNGAFAALGTLANEGFALICVTNQPDVARGAIHPSDVDAMNAWIRAELPLDDVIVCAHDDRDGCPCRKPKPGMLIEGARRFDIDLARSYMVGDRWRDIDAGANAGCTTVFIDRGYAERSSANSPAATVRSIVDAASWILEQSAT